MKRVVLFCGLFFINSVYAESSGPFYVKFDAGVSSPKYSIKHEDYYLNNNFSPKSFFGAGVGYSFSENISSDMVFTIRNRNTLKNYSSDAEDTRDITQSFYSKTLMLNTNYTFAPGNTFRPYLSAGLGVSYNTSGNYRAETLVKLDNSTTIETSPRSSKLRFAHSFGAGIKTKISDKSSIDFFYRYINLGKSSSVSITDETNGGTEFVTPGSLKSHDFGLSLTYKF